MAVRTTAVKVKAILLGQYDAVAAHDLTAFLDSAAIIVKRVVACDIASDSVLDSDDLEIIERWLAAHLYAHADQLLSSKSTADASGTYQGKTGMGLESTQYGQTAMDMDASGCLRSMNKGNNQLTVGWLGKSVSSQIAYGNRD